MRRFVIEEGVAALYVYELQVAAAARRRGLGKFLMMLCEALGKKAGVSGRAHPHIHSQLILSLSTVEVMTFFSSAMEHR